MDGDCAGLPSLVETKGRGSVPQAGRDEGRGTVCHPTGLNMQKWGKKDYSLLPFLVEMRGGRLFHSTVPSLLEIRATLGDYLQNNEESGTAAFYSVWYRWGVGDCATLPNKEKKMRNVLCNYPIQGRNEEWGTVAFFQFSKNVEWGSMRSAELYHSPKLGGNEKWESVPFSQTRQKWEVGECTILPD